MVVGGVIEDDGGAVIAAITASGLALTDCGGMAFKCLTWWGSEQVVACMWEDVLPMKDMARGLVATSRKLFRV